MKKLIFIILLFATYSKAITFEKSCYNSAVGPVSSITCTFTDMEPFRTFWITLHFTGASTPTFMQYSRPACMNFVSGPASYPTIGQDYYVVQMLRTTGTSCCSGSQTFTFNFYSSLSPLTATTATKVQINIYQIQGLGTYTAMFYGFNSGTGGSPSASDTGVLVGNFAAVWVSTARGTGTTFGAGTGYTLKDAVSPDTWEWTLADGTNPFPGTVSGTTLGHWLMTMVAVNTGTSVVNPSYCGSKQHRRNTY